MNMAACHCHGYAVAILFKYGRWLKIEPCVLLPLIWPVIFVKYGTASFGPCVKFLPAFIYIVVIYIPVLLYACVLFGFAQRLDGSAFASEYVHVCTLCLSDCSRKSNRSCPLCITGWSLHIQWYGLCICISLWSMCLIYIYELGVWYWLVPRVYRMMEWLCVSITLEWPCVMLGSLGFCHFGLGLLPRPGRIIALCVDFNSAIYYIF